MGFNPGFKGLTEINTRNIYWRSKGGRCGKVVLKSESLTLLELSGPVQACNGIALALRI